VLALRVMPTPIAGPTRDNAPYRVRVHGHERVLDALTRTQGARPTAQAYLLTGAPGVGKRTVARALAQTLLCSGGVDPSPCGTCRACRLVREGTFPDLHLVPSPLRIEAVRDLQRVLVLSPAESAWRVVIVPDVEAASPGAANSLLKTLEEPPSHVVLVLTTSAPGMVLPTVRSRCRTVTLRPLPVDVVAAALASEWGVATDRAALAAALSGGRLGWAVGAAGTEGPLEARADWLDQLAAVLAADRAGRMVRARVLADLGDTMGDCLSTWRGWWRDVMVVQHGADRAVTNVDRLDELRAAAARYRPRQVLAAVRGLDDVLGRLAANANPRLAVEVLLLGMPG
jgi:DNA polymerase III subunit delta'